MSEGVPVTRAAVIGTGVIGAGWAALFLARGLDVTAWDPAVAAEERLRGDVAAMWPVLTRLGLAEGASQDRLTFATSVADAVAEADVAQESGPEVLEPKQALIAEIDAAAPAHAVIASSSSGQLPSDLQRTCGHHPERVLVGHPFSPAHLVPLVEVVPGRRTDPDVADRALAFYRALGKRPILVRQELPGHVTNRLQVALWREAYALVQRGAATVADIDAAIANGPGLRWALLGPLVNQHLGGGAGGMAHVLEPSRAAGRGVDERPVADAPSHARSRPQAGRRRRRGAGRCRPGRARRRTRRAPRGAPRAEAGARPGVSRGGRTGRRTTVRR